MENNLPVIPIFFAVDDGYVPFLAVALESIIANSSKKYYYYIKILYTDISDENKKKIGKYNSNNVNIEFVDLNYYIDEIKDKLYTRDYYTKTTYFRLFIPNLYPQYNKVIYLDSDVAVLGDISELYNIDVDGKLLAAAPDDVIQTTRIFQEYVEKVIGTSSYKNYFNAGILLMNLDEMRRFDFQNKFMYLLGTVKYTVVQDQDYLNRICKGRVTLISGVWNRMPIANDKIKDEDIKIIHYNLAYKPWHFENIMYQEYFWKYATKTEYIDQIKHIKETYTEEQRFEDRNQFEKLKVLAAYETDCVGDDRESKMKEIDTDKRNERLKILKKIEDYESEGTFDIDVEDDPKTITLMPEDVDYLNEKSYSKLKSIIANRVGARFLNELIRGNKLIIKEIKGMENLQSVKSGAIITCNHFNPYDSFAIE
jgi:lipopolysaccharide biosynthesis glycosyltransferase